jgi:hypothetical protein
MQVEKYLLMKNQSSSVNFSDVELAKTIQICFISTIYRHGYLTGCELASEITGELWEN